MGTRQSSSSSEVVLTSAVPNPPPSRSSPQQSRTLPARVTPSSSADYPRHFVPPEDLTSTRGHRHAHHHHQRRPLPPLPPNASHETSSRREWEVFLEELGVIQPPTHSDQPPLPPRPSPPLVRTLHAHERSTNRDHNHRRRRHRHREEERGVAPASFSLLTPAGTNHENPFLLLRELTRTSKCPVCSQYVPSIEYEAHRTSCKPAPTIQFNEDVLLTEAGECSICLEDMIPGDEIARLPCLCVYHVKCIGEWFRVKEICPQHPDLNISPSS